MLLACPRNRGVALVNAGLCNFWVIDPIDRRQGNRIDGSAFVVNAPSVYRVCRPVLRRRVATENDIVTEG